MDWKLIIFDRSADHAYHSHMHIHMHIPISTTIEFIVFEVENSLTFMKKVAVKNDVVKKLKAKRAKSAF